MSTKSVLSADEVHISRSTAWRSSTRSADHGNDPTHTGTDHTREHVPLLVYGPPSAAGIDLGLRDSFCDVAATLAEALLNTTWDGCGAGFHGLLDG